MDNRFAFIGLLEARLEAGGRLSKAVTSSERLLMKPALRPEALLHSVSLLDALLLYLARSLSSECSL
jgi:hypothetical protein